MVKSRSAYPGSSQLVLCDIIFWRSRKRPSPSQSSEPQECLLTSFVVQCICAVLKRIIFVVDKEELGEVEELLSVVLERQISYLADEDRLNGLLKHLGDRPWYDKTSPCKPFSL